jgi:hypothetical protein
MNMPDNELNNKDESLRKSLDDENTGAVPEPREIIDEEGKKVLVFHDPLYSREKGAV